MKRTYVEVSCDACGCADFFRPPRVDAQARDHDWLIEGRKHFCDEACKAKFYTTKKELTNV